MALLQQHGQTFECEKITYGTKGDSASDPFEWFQPQLFLKLWYGIYCSNISGGYVVKMNNFASVPCYLAVQVIVIVIKRFR